MKRVRLSIQIALSLALLSATIMFAAKGLGLLPDHRQNELKTRIALCENLAVTSSILANRRDWEGVQLLLRELKSRNLKVVSAGLRSQDDRLMSEVGVHSPTWHHTPNRQSTDTQIYVPILQGKQKWGHLEVAFEPLNTHGLPGWIDLRQWQLVLFVAAASALSYLIYLGRVLYELDPSRVMPQRVRSAFDTLSEGLLVLDNAGRIVLANQAMANAVGRKPDDLLGIPASLLPFEELSGSAMRPWEAARTNPQGKHGVEMALADGSDTPKTFFVNAAPIEDSKGNTCGVLTSFADITQLEHKKQELLKMLDALRESRDKIRQQNDELSFLATRDPLTGCFNRRSFFEQFERAWQQENAGELSCIMTDIDKFKSINDNHGHSMGDEVLKRVAGALLDAVGNDGLVCRYGGEEFCIVLPNCSLDQAAERAEIIRQRVAALEFNVLQATSSFGVSSRIHGAASCQDLLDQADKSLYFSKRNGRNRVTRWDELPADAATHEPARKTTNVPTVAPPKPQVPYHAVACLLRALAYRDPDTASHSARVADLAVATARGLMSAGDAYILEIAALLHDIGKIGVPDAILLKPGKLTAEEWRIMNMHARIGVEIVASSFDCESLVDIVRYHHAFFGNTNPGEPRGTEIPVGARIVTICDAYDAMVTDRVYRPGRPPEVAFEELRRMAGAQFDPELVERFIEVVTQRKKSAPQAEWSVSKELALNLGLHTERLAGAVDSFNFAEIRAIATHLKSTAECHGLVALAEATELLQGSSADSDLGQLVEVVHEIISLSLAAQQAHLEMNEDMTEIVQARGQQPPAPTPALA